VAVALVGLPGAGKSAVGRRLAQRLQVPFVDSDHEIEQRIGCSIRDYFEREGEASFRDIETRVIADLAAAPSGVVATGGGAVLREANRDQLRSHFHVIYLRASPEDLFRRLRHDVKRPLLQVADPLGRLRELYAARDPFYRETAHDVVETGRPTVTMLVNIIVMQLELAGIRFPEPEVDPPA
jgi:shikimate kinase